MDGSYQLLAELDRDGKLVLTGGGFQSYDVVEWLLANRDNAYQPNQNRL